MFVSNTPSARGATARPPQPLQSDNQRQLDLLRYCRHELCEKGLITLSEYSDLLQMSGAVARLGSYDEVRAKAVGDVAVERERCAKILEAASFHGDMEELRDGDIAEVVALIRSGK